MENIQHQLAKVLNRCLFLLQKNQPRIFIWSGFLVVSFFIFWSFLLSPAFSLVDDGYSLTKGRSLVSEISLQNWSNTLIESNIGRFRPIYIASFSLTYLLFGSHPIGLWFTQSLVLWGTLVVLYELLFHLTRRQTISVVLPLVWLTFPAVAENIFRVGTAEPKQILFALIGIFCLLQSQKLKNKVWLFISILFALFAIGTKETSIFLLPFYALILLKDKIERANLSMLPVAFGVSLFALVLLVFIGFRFFFTSGYAVDNFGLDYSNIIIRLNQNRLNFAHYYLLIWVGLISFLLRSMVAIWTKKLKTLRQSSFISLALLLVIVETVFFTLAWSFQFERYLYPTWIFITLFLGIELSQWLMLSHDHSTLKKLNRDRQVILLATASVIFAGGFFVIFEGNGLNYPALMAKNLNVYHRSYDINQVEQTIIGTLLSDNQTEILYTTNDNYEVIYELGLYLSQFGKRKVIVISPSSELAAAEPGYEYQAQPWQAFTQDTRPNTAIVGRIADFKGLELPVEAKIFQAPTRYRLIAEDQFWWILKGNQ